MTTYQKRAAGDAGEMREEDMDKDQAGLFKLIEGLKPVEPSALADFEREMADEAIPAMLAEAERRRMLAAESRNRQLEMPSTDKPGPTQD